MNQSLTPNQVAQLKDCLALSQEPAQHDEAKRIFAELLTNFEPNPATAELIDTLWNELLAARRSATFWQQISDVEKEMGERLAQNHMQLQQNHLRLIQEQ